MTSIVKPATRTPATAPKMGDRYYTDSEDGLVLVTIRCGYVGEWVCDAVETTESYVRPTAELYVAA